MEINNLSQRIYSYNPDIALSLYSKTYHSDDHPTVKEVKNGIILPPIHQTGENYLGGVCDENFKFMGGFVVNKNYNGSQKFVYDSYVVSDKEIQYIDEEVVFGGVMQNHPGHLTRDGFAARMWWHVKNPNSKLKIAVIMLWEEWPKDGSNFVGEFIDLIGIPKERLLILRQPTKFKSVYVPEQCIYTYSGGYTDEYMSVIEKLSSGVEPGKYDKVYFSKTLTDKKDVINEEYYVDFFKKKGFEIINPEELSMREKISVLKGAKEFATINGTNSIFAIFCNPSVKLILLERNCESFSAQPWINEARGIKDFYSVTISLNFLSDHYVWGTKFFGITDEWKRFVKDVYGEEISETPQDVLKEYSYDYLKAFAEYTAQPKIFEYFKKSDHFKILETMNRLFLGKTLDPDNYNIERISDYKNQVSALKEQLTISRSANRAQNDLSQRLVAALLDKLSAKADIGPADKEKLMRCTFKPTLTYQLHAGGKWLPKVSDEEIAGADGSKKPMISLIINNIDCGAHIFYSVYTSEEGWTIDSREGKKAGAIKKSLPVKGIRVRLDDDTAEYYSVRYRVFTHPKGWTAWVADGAATPRRSCKMIDAVQIQIVQKDGYVKKAEALYDKYLSEIDSALSDGDRLAEDSAKRGLEAEMLALKNKADAQEYVIKSLEQAIATLINNKKSED